MLLVPFVLRANYLPIKIRGNCVLTASHLINRTRSKLLQRNHLLKFFFFVKLHHIIIFKSLALYVIPTIILLTRISLLHNLSKEFLLVIPWDKKGEKYIIWRLVKFLSVMLLCSMNIFSITPWTYPIPILLVLLLHHFMSLVMIIMSPTSRAWMTTKLQILISHAWSPHLKKPSHRQHVLRCSLYLPHLKFQFFL